MELLYWLSYRAQRENLVTNQVPAAGCEKLLQKGGSSSFVQQNLYTLRVLPAQDKLVLQQVT